MQVSSPARRSVPRVDDQSGFGSLYTTPFAPTPRGTWGNFGETRGGVGKSGVLEHKSGNTRKDTGKVTMEGL